ncbi:hypothetical protein [Bombella apis]|uniref:Uncharacterized protein n=1 Tax=Bombella apis TaxID=1785988 RepID=A0ABR9MMZ2_9PROT|nr:hypothetical protein [Bombella apis]MBE1723206.1 hypothetical protein [Bombella apis]MBR9731013.1 hypothetical protein [Bombella apis]
MNVTPTIESLRLAVELIKAGKFSDNKVIPVAAMFDGYLCGAIAAEISFDADGRPAVELSERNTIKQVRRTDSHSAGCTGSVARPLSGLSVDELQQITSRTIKPWFKERAEAELALRQGEVGAS